MEFPNFQEYDEPDFVSVINIKKEIESEDFNDCTTNNVRIKEEYMPCEADDFNEINEEFLKDPAPLNFEEVNINYIDSLIKIPKTSAQRAKEYRQRQKQIKNGFCSPKKVPKSTAQRAKEYRQRQKKMKSELGASNSDDSQRSEETETTLPKPKTNSEKCREYRARKKAAREAAVRASAASISTDDDVTKVNEDDDMPHSQPHIPDEHNSWSLFSDHITWRRPKTNAERSRRYRARKKAATEAAVYIASTDNDVMEMSQNDDMHRSQPQTPVDCDITTHPRPMTNAEKCREYRERKKSAAAAAAAVASSVKAPTQTLWSEISWGSSTPCKNDVQLR